MELCTAEPPQGVSALMAEKIFYRKCPTKIKLNVSNNCIIETIYDEDPPLWTLGPLNLDFKDIEYTLYFMYKHPEWFNTHKHELYPFLALLKNSPEYSEEVEQHPNLFEHLNEEKVESTLPI